MNGGEKRDVNRSRKFRNAQKKIGRLSIWQIETDEDANHIIKGEMK